MIFEVLFVALVGSLAGSYFGYPLVIGALARLAPYRPAATASEGGALPSLTLLVPAYNEEAVIEQRILNFLESDYPADRLECAVVSDGSTDGTCRLVRELLETLPEKDRSRIRLFDRRSRSGKTVALSETVPQTRGSLLVFTDANTRFEPDALRLLARPFADPRVGLVCGRLHYRDDASGVGGGEGLYWRYENALKENEGRIGRLLVSNGSIYTVRRELFEPVPGPVADDLVVPLVVGSRGYLSLYEREAAASELLPSDHGEDFESKARIITQGLEAVRRYRGRILASGPARTTQYVFHKGLRWFAPQILILALLVSIAGRDVPWLGAMLWVQGVFYALAFAGWLQRNSARPLVITRVPFYFCLLNAAALKAFWDFLQRRDRSTWEKSDSTRREV